MRFRDWFWMFLDGNLSYADSDYYLQTNENYLDMIRNKGRRGEFRIAEELQWLLKEDAKFLYNVYIPKENGKTAEIDILIISEKGIFVIESKNYSGWIFGDERSLNWTQTLPTGHGKSVKERFYNPIMQNQNHIKSLKRFIDEDIPFTSLIVFSDSCEFKKLVINSADIFVVNLKNLTQKIKTIYEAKPYCLCKEKVDSLYYKLYPFTLLNNDEKTIHIENVKKDLSKTYIVKGQELTEEDLTCPWCGGKLVLRTAKHGNNIGNKFYGCSNYPKCRYIKQIKENK